MERDVLSGGQPCGLAAASARGRRPPKAGGGPTKYLQLAFRNSYFQDFAGRANVLKQLPIASNSLLLQTNLRLYAGERLVPIGALDFPRKDITQRFDLDNKALGLRSRQTKHSELCHFEAKAFLMRRGDGRARPAGGRGLTAAASALWALAAAQKEIVLCGTLLSLPRKHSPSYRQAHASMESALPSHFSGTIPTLSSHS